MGSACGFFLNHFVILYQRGQGLRDSMCLLSRRVHCFENVWRKRAYEIASAHTVSWVLLKRHFKIEFENRNCKSVVVLLSDSILASFWTPYGESFRASGALVPSKRQGFREPGALDSQKVVSHPV